MSDETINEVAAHVPSLREQRFGQWMLSAGEKSESTYETWCAGWEAHRAYAAAIVGEMIKVFLERGELDE